MTWDDYFSTLMCAVAQKSKDPTKVGALLVGPDREIRLTAFNGPPKGIRDTPDRFERPCKYLFASHAEANLIAFAAREGIRTANCTIYVTHMPCSSCARAIIQAGVVQVFFGPGKTSMPTEEFLAANVMFDEAGVKCNEVQSSA